MYRCEKWNAYVPVQSSPVALPPEFCAWVRWIVC